MVIPFLIVVSGKQRVTAEKSNITIFPKVMEKYSSLIDVLQFFVWLPLSRR